MHNIGVYDTASSVLRHWTIFALKILGADLEVEDLSWIADMEDDVDINKTWKVWMGDTIFDQMYGIKHVI